MTFIAAQRCNNFYFSRLDTNPITADYSGGIELANHEKFWLNFLVVTQILNGVILFISLIWIRIIIAKTGNNRMVDRSGFLVHGFLFLSYMCSTFYWAVWNRQSINALDANFTPWDLLHIKTMEAEYEKWLKRYYICLMQFSIANLGVQLFTIYIFFGLTRKKKEKVIDKYSVLSGDSIKRISMLEADKNHPVTPEHRSNSLTTQDMQGGDDVSAHDRHFS